MWDQCTENRKKLRKQYKDINGEPGSQDLDCFVKQKPGIVVSSEAGVKCENDDDNDA